VKSCAILLLHHHHHHHYHHHHHHHNPMFHLFLTRWVSQLVGLAWAFARIGVTFQLISEVNHNLKTLLNISSMQSAQGSHTRSHFASIFGVFHSLLSAIGFQSCFFLSAPFTFKLFRWVSRFCGPWGGVILLMFISFLSNLLSRFWTPSYYSVGKNQSNW